MSCPSIFKCYKSQLNVQKFSPNCFAKILDKDHEAPVFFMALKGRKRYSWAVQVKGKPACLAESLLTCWHARPVLGLLVCTLEPTCPSEMLQEGNSILIMWNVYHIECILECLLLILGVVVIAIKIFFLKLGFHVAQASFKLVV